jgi:hypothetical protein
MGLFFRRKVEERTASPERQAYDQVWNREVGRLGQGEVVRRIAAVNDYRSGRTGPSGFEGWNLRMEREVMQLAYEIADRDDR